MQLSKDNINFLREFISKRTAISIGDDKEYLLESRFAPVIKKFNLKSYDELILKLKIGDEQVVTECIDAISTNETYFFRDLKPFQLFEKEVIPRMRDISGGLISIWSAACSTGQEPYSIAISMLENKFKLGTKKFEITATDISNKVLTRSKEGVYNSFEIQRGLPAPLMIKYFDKTDYNSWKVKDEVKENVVFRKQNLLDDFPWHNNLDCIFCRYVLIYFDETTKKDILRRMVQCLKPGGALFLGTSETTNLMPEALVQSEEIRSLFFKKES